MLSGGEFYIFFGIVYVQCGGDENLLVKEDACKISRFTLNSEILEIEIKIVSNITKRENVSSRFQKKTIKAIGNVV